MGGQGGRGRTIRTVAPKAPPTGARPSDAFTRAQKREPYSRMRLTRTLDERLVAGHGQTEAVGGLFRSLGKAADAAGRTVARERRDVLSPLIRHMGSMLVKWASPLEILRRRMAALAAGVAHFFTLRGADCVGQAYDAAGATASGAVRWAARY